MNKPCEYCGTDLPEGVDSHTRRVRSYHFTRCDKRPPLVTIQPIDALLLRRAREALADIAGSEDPDYMRGVAQDALKTL